MHENGPDYFSTQPRSGKVDFVLKKNKIDVLW